MDGATGQLASSPSWVATILPQTRAKEAVLSPSIQGLAFFPSFSDNIPRPALPTRNRADSIFFF